MVGILVTAAGLPLSNGGGVAGLAVVGLVLGLPGVTVGAAVLGVFDTTAGLPFSKGGGVTGLAVVGLELGLPGVTVGMPLVGSGE